MLNRKGQNVLEYSILIALVVGAAIAMQTYVKRGIQGRVKDAVDHTGAAAGDVGGAPLTFTSKQYVPYYEESHATVSSDAVKNSNIGVNGQVANTGITEETRKAAGSNDIVKGTAGAD